MLNPIDDVLLLLLQLGHINIHKMCKQNTKATNYGYISIILMQIIVVSKAYVYSI